MTETELQKRDAQCDLGAELLKSVRQMAARKRPCRHVIRHIRTKKNPRCRKLSLPSCLVCLCETRKIGNKGDASPAAQPRL
jgi:hypothetical protein